MKKVFIGYALMLAIVSCGNNPSNDNNLNNDRPAVGSDSNSSMMDTATSTNSSSDTSQGVGTSGAGAGSGTSAGASGRTSGVPPELVDTTSPSHHTGAGMDTSARHHHNGKKGVKQ